MAAAEGSDAGNEAGRDAAAATAPGAQPASPTDRDSAANTFFTSINAEPAPKSRQKEKQKAVFPKLQACNAGPRVVEHHGDLTNFAITLDQRMQRLLDEHEKDFFLAYKTHMYSVQRDIKTLRMKADHEEAKTREDTTIKALEGELEWFMTEALRLDELCKGYKKEVDKWKQKAEALDEDRRFLEDQIKGAKRQNKILRAAAERARSSAYSALMVTKARAEAGGSAAPVTTAASSDLAELTTALAERPASAGDVAANGAGRAIQDRATTPDAATGGGTAPLALPAPAPAYPGALQGSGTKGPYPAAGGATTALSGTGRPTSSGGPILGGEAEERYVEAIQHLKESIIREQHNVRMLQAHRATTYANNSQYEEFFLKCIAEAKKELNHKQHNSLYKEKSEKQQVLEAMLRNEDVLVCLYEKLFPHRSGIARSLGGAGEGDEARLLAAPVTNGSRR